MTVSSVNFTGLGSGVDTASIVTQLMAIERRPVQQMQARIDTASARLTGLNDVRARLATLRSAESALRAAGTFAPHPTATSSDAARIGVTADATAVKAQYAVTVTALARADVATQGSTVTAAGTADTLTVASGGTSVDVAIGAGDTVDQIAAKINAANGSATASVVSGRLRLTAKATGAGGAIAVSSNGSLATDLGMTTTLAGRDATFTVDGQSYTRASNTVSDVLAGATMTLRGATAGPATVDVDPAKVNADAVVDLAKGFIAAYNGLVDTMRSAMAERPVPTSASAGAHFADSLYGNVLDRLSGAVHAVVGAAPTSPQAASIGISTGAPTGTYSPDAVSGRLVLDEAKLRSALDRDPNAVEALLAGGVAARVDAVVADVTGTNGVVAGRIRSENARIAAYQASADQLNVRLANHETTLRRQFTAMEQAVGQLRELQSRLPSLGGA